MSWGRQTGMHRLCSGPTSTSEKMEVRCTRSNYIHSVHLTHEQYELPIRHPCALPQAHREARVPVHSTHFQVCDSGFAAPDHPHLQKMLELFTAQWAGFVAKETKVHALANTPQATIFGHHS